MEKVRRKEGKLSKGRKGGRGKSSTFVKSSFDNEMSVSAEIRRRTAPYLLRCCDIAEGCGKFVGIPGIKNPFRFIFFVSPLLPSSLWSSL